MDYGALLETTRKVHVRSGKGTLASLADIVACGFRYQAGYMDYLVFEFDRLTAVSYTHLTLPTKSRV